ncbi:hypothetical protein COT72_03860 [archaeon CG10_big_fil_rev_8_21_14_0_10_43_11]|nr:MAG: hypothetical protein COT72_03860 [archaeon CG10_big_fil_rev_8_21_14_0_10_43_11]
MNEREARVVQYLRTNGPSLPVQVSKALEENVMFASALLGGLVATKQIRLTRKKIGNSPLYFLPEHINHARRIIYDRLDPREKELVDFVTKKGVVREDELTPTERFFIKDLVDFFESEQENNQTYWKVPGTNAKPTLEPPKPLVSKPEPSARREEQQPFIKQEAEPHEEKKPIHLKDSGDDEFTRKVKHFFVKRGIRILNTDVVRSNAEINFTVQIQGDLIPQTYFVKARKKKKINDNDLIAAWFEGRKQKAPILYLATGELTKKAEKFLKEEFGENFTFLKVSV